MVAYTVNREIMNRSWATHAPTYTMILSCITLLKVSTVVNFLPYLSISNSFLLLLLLFNLRLPFSCHNQLVSISCQLISPFSIFQTIPPGVRRKCMRHLSEHSVKIGTSTMAPSVVYYLALPIHNIIKL